jgi:formylmethanofuran dehydrogenase subunit E
VSASSWRTLAAVLGAFVVVACGTAPPPRGAEASSPRASGPESHVPVPPHGGHAHGHGHAHAGHGLENADASGKPSGDDDVLRAVTQAHGGAGPWAVLGYRMGAFALKKLGLERGSFDLEVRHESPAEVQFTCVADGTQASTGASLGRLTLTHVAVPRERMRTSYRKKSTGETIALRPSPAFVARFENVPRERLGEAGREVLRLSDDELFEVVPEGAPK